MYDLKVTFYANSGTGESTSLEQYFQTGNDDGTEYFAEQLQKNDHWTALYFLRTGSATGNNNMDFLYEMIEQYGDGRIAKAPAPTPKPIQSYMPDYWHGGRAIEGIYGLASRFNQLMSDQGKVDLDYELQLGPAPTPQPVHSPSPKPIQSYMPDYWHGGRLIGGINGHVSRFVVFGVGAVLFVGVMFMAFKKKLQEVDAGFEPLV